MSRFENDLLLIPGPTPIPPPVLRALSEPAYGHRTPRFSKNLESVTARLKEVFGTHNDVIVFASSGTGGMEAAIANVHSPGDRILVVEIGAFGARWAEIASRYGLDVVRLEVEWGKAADPAAVDEALASSGAKSIAFTHNETSTGVTNPTQAILEVANKHGALSIIDAISGLMASELPMDAWGADIVVGGSQKAFAIPPGLAFVALSERAWKATEAATCPVYYFDLPAMRKSLAKWTTAYTGATTLVRALDVALELLLADGLQASIAAHHNRAEAVRAAIKAMGLNLFADEAFASDSVTAVLPPAGIDPDAMRKDLSKRFGIHLAGGQKSLQGKIFRISHLGVIEPYQILGALACLEITLRAHGHTGFDLGAGVAAAEARFEGYEG